MEHHFFNSAQVMSDGWTALEEERDAYITRLARHFLRRDINLVDVLLICNMVNKYSCEPALDLEEVEQIVYLVCGEELMELSEWE